MTMRAQANQNQVWSWVSERSQRTSNPRMRPGQSKKPSTSERSAYLGQVVTRPQMHGPGVLVVGLAGLAERQRFNDAFDRRPDGIVHELMGALAAAVSQPETAAASTFSDSSP